MLRFLDEARPPTEDERALLVRTPRTITRLVYGGWTIAAVIIGGMLLIDGGNEKAAVASVVGNLLSGLIAGNVAYLVAEQQLRRPYASAFTAAAPEERRHFGARRRLLLAWSLGSGIPLLGIAVTPAIRDRGAEVSASVPMALLAILGLVAGALITMIDADALATPMTRLRHAMARVREGELDAGVAVDSPGEVGQVQAGFNEMVEGLRQRERLQDLFGRHVGEDVARRAVEEGVHLGGERGRPPHRRGQAPSPPDAVGRGRRRMGGGRVPRAEGRRSGDLLHAGYRFPRRACSRSIASNSALKLPAPNPLAPSRWMTSKNTVGRSVTVSVNTWSR